MRYRDGRPGAEKPALVVAQREMRAHEYLVWAERPTGGAIRREAVRGVISGIAFSFFAVVWGVLAFLFTAGNVGPPFSLVPYIGVVFFFLGLMVVFGSIKTWRLRRSTIYALSRERVVAMTESPPYRARSFDLSSITGLDCQERWGGSGTLILTLGSSRREKLIGVPKVRQVADQIERLRRKSRSHET